MKEDGSEILARLERCKMPQPAESLKRRVLSDAKAAMRRELEKESGPDVKGCVKFLLACAAAFAALVAGSGAIADLIAKAPETRSCAASQAELVAKALDLQPDESLVKRMALLEKMALESRAQKGPSSLEIYKAALERETKS